jgi:DNA-binding XRE family transcriptional regulator
MGTSGDHIRRKRLTLKLMQGGVAELLGLTSCSVYGWENEHPKPSVEPMPAIAGQEPDQVALVDSWAFQLTGQQLSIKTSF